MNLVLLEPEIPPNTGNIARLCAVTRTTLHLIEPLGFRLEDKELKRAGMDYWRNLDWYRWKNWRDFAAAHEGRGRFWFIESGGRRHYAEIEYAPNDSLIFGRETKGLPSALLESHSDQWLRIPMFHPDTRSLNLANCAALVLYEALRQRGFADETFA